MPETKPDIDDQTFQMKVSPPLPERVCPCQQAGNRNPRPLKQHHPNCQHRWGCQENHCHLMVCSLSQRGGPPKKDVHPVLSPSHMPQWYVPSNEVWGVITGSLHTSFTLTKARETKSRRLAVLLHSCTTCTSLRIQRLSEGTAGERFGRVLLQKCSYSTGLLSALRELQASKYSWRSVGQVTWWQPQKKWWVLVLHRIFSTGSFHPAIPKWVLRKAFCLTYLKHSSCISIIRVSISSNCVSSGAT